VWLNANQMKKRLIVIVSGLVVFGLIMVIGYETYQRRVDLVAPVDETANTSQAITNQEGLPDFLESMSLADKIGQMMMGGYFKDNLIEEQLALVEELNFGGIIIMGPNVANLKATGESMALIRLTNQRLASPLLISIDEEGTAITRLRGQLKEQTPQANITAVERAYEVARRRGQELRNLGIQINFSPVLEYIPGSDSFLYQRTFQVDRTRIAPLGAAMLKGYRDSGIVGVVKHFPGHTQEAIDSHLDLPVARLTLNELNGHMSQFAELFKITDAPMVMTAHILLPEIDANYPATLSPVLINDILRKRMGYEGVIITDDLAMGAIVNNYSPAESAVQAVKAGNDILLYVTAMDEQREAYEAVLAAVRSGQISEARIDESVLRIYRLKQLVNLE
jgi:beta-N-acetylhexosaminidase